jgi:hypothetical protein
MTAQGLDGPRGEALARGRGSVYSFRSRSEQRSLNNPKHLKGLHPHPAILYEHQTPG